MMNNHGVVELSESQETCVTVTKLPILAGEINTFLWELNKPIGQLSVRHDDGGISAFSICRVLEHILFKLKRFQQGQTGKPMLFKILCSAEIWISEVLLCLKPRQNPQTPHGYSSFTFVPLELWKTVQTEVISWVWQVLQFFRCKNSVPCHSLKVKNKPKALDRYLLSSAHDLVSPLKCYSLLADSWDGVDVRPFQMHLLPQMHIFSKCHKYWLISRTNKW